MHPTVSILKKLTAGISLILALVLLTPTFVSLLSIVHPDVSINLVIQNPLEEEREEERSGGEEDNKELKDFTLPGNLVKKDAYTLTISARHLYSFRPYASVISLPDFPPERLG